MDKLFDNVHQHLTITQQHVRDIIEQRDQTIAELKLTVVWVREELAQEKKERREEECAQQLDERLRLSGLERVWAKVVTVSDGILDQNEHVQFVSKCEEAAQLPAEIPRLRGLTFEQSHDALTDVLTSVQKEQEWSTLKCAYNTKVYVCVLLGHQHSSRRRVNVPSFCLFIHC